jgi:hypothetical protein
MEEKVARAYDLSALKYWQPSTHINFPAIYIYFRHYVDSNLMSDSNANVHFYYLL